MCNNISEIIGIEVENLKTTQNLGLYIHKNGRYPHLTNGPIEGINNKIKLIKRISYGYRNFYNFKNRILIISRIFVSEYKKVLSN